MARRTISETIAKFETRRDNLEKKIEEHESYKSIKGQGSQGATTEFTDPSKLEQSLDRVNNKLENLYRQQGL